MNKNITMKVYDILGNEIKTLVNGDVAKGSYEVTWDGTNNFNQPVASGTYITVLNTETLLNQ
jgi:flagellar hook assembly protein FlgD